MAFSSQLLQYFKNNNVNKKHEEKKQEQNENISTNNNNSQNLSEMRYRNNNSQRYSTMMYNHCAITAIHLLIKKFSSSYLYIFIIPLVPILLLVLYEVVLHGLPLTGGGPADRTCHLRDIHHPVPVQVNHVGRVVITAGLCQLVLKK